MRWRTRYRRFHGVDEERALSFRLDHLIYGVTDLDAAAERFAVEHGLGSVPGGRHPGWGTANVIVPLGDEYVELVGVVDETEAAGTPFGEWVLRGTSGGDRLLGWAVATDDIEPVGRRLNLDVIQGGRIRPDGVSLSWRVAGIERMLATEGFPIFLEWTVPADQHPGRGAARHRVEPRGLTWISVRGDEDAFSAWLGPDHGLPLRVEPGEPAIVAAGVGTAETEIVLR